MSTTTTKPRERPVLFTGKNVRRIMEGLKTKTRRVIRNPERLDGLMMAGEEADWCPYGGPGDLLYVRETFSLNHSIHYSHVSANGTSGIIYRASWPSGTDHYDRPFEGERRWRPSIHMPKWAARIWLEVTGVRAERLQEISPVDVLAEGVSTTDPRASVLRAYFADSWDDINAKRDGCSWDANPWVWVVSFRPVEREAARG